MEEHCDKAKGYIKLVSIFLILSLLFGCTSGSEETEEPVTNYIYVSRDGSQILRLIYEYNQMNELDQSEAEESQGQNQIYRRN